MFFPLRNPPTFGSVAPKTSLRPATAREALSLWKSLEGGMAQTVVFQPPVGVAQRWGNPAVCELYDLGLFDEEQRMVKDWIGPGPLRQHSPIAVIADNNMVFVAEVGLLPYDKIQLLTPRVMAVENAIWLRVLTQEGKMGLLLLNYREFGVSIHKVKG
jgi:hypothetical protein